MSTTCYRLDSIGEAGFSHSFDSIKNRKAPFIVMLDGFGDIKPSFMEMLAPFLAFTFPDPLLWLPNDERRKKSKELNESLRSIATDLLAKAAQEQSSDPTKKNTDKSILGILGKSHTS